MEPEFHCCRICACHSLPGLEPGTSLPAHAPTNLRLGQPRFDPKGAKGKPSCLSHQPTNLPKSTAGCAASGDGVPHSHLPTVPIELVPIRSVDDTVGIHRPSSMSAKGGYSCQHAVWRKLSKVTAAWTGTQPESAGPVGKPVEG